MRPGMRRDLNALDEATQAGFIFAEIPVSDLISAETDSDFRNRRGQGQ